MPVAVRMAAKTAVSMGMARAAARRRRARTSRRPRTLAGFVPVVVIPAMTLMRGVTVGMIVPVIVGVRVLVPVLVLVNVLMTVRVLVNVLMTVPELAIVFVRGPGTGESG